MAQGTSSTQSEVVESLVARAAAGDRECQHALLQRYGALMRAVVRARLRRAAPHLGLREQPEDLDQDVAIKLLASLPKHTWQGKRAFLAWMKKVADNHLRDRERYHAAAARNRLAETGEARVDTPRRARWPSPESRVDRDRQLAEIERRLAEVKPEYAAAVRLHAMGYSHAEIGDVLACSPEGARKLVARGTVRLQQLVGAANDEA